MPQYKSLVIFVIFVDETDMWKDVVAERQGHFEVVRLVRCTRRGNQRAVPEPLGQTLQSPRGEPPSGSMAPVGTRTSGEKVPILHAEFHWEEVKPLHSENTDLRGKLWNKMGFTCNAGRDKGAMEVLEASASEPAA